MGLLMPGRRIGNAFVADMKRSDRENRGGGGGGLLIVADTGVYELKKGSQRPFTYICRA